MAVHYLTDAVLTYTPKYDHYVYTNREFCNDRDNINI